MFFTIEKIQSQLKEIRKAIVREAIDITDFKYWEGPFPEPGENPVPGAECPEFDDRHWKDFSLGEFWGGYDRLAWFRTWLDIPAEWRKEKLALRFLVGPRDGGNSTAETLLYVDGTPLQAIDVWHPRAWLPEELTRRPPILIALKAWSGVLGVPERRHFQQAQLVRIDRETENFYYRCDTLLRAVKVLDANDLRRDRMLQALQSAFLQIDFLKPGSEAFYNSIAEANGCLEEELAQFQMLTEVKPRVVGIGHAHIDMAWLWRLRHTREKAARTFTTALHLMRQFPEYRFMHSSPQLYKFLKEDYPDLFERVKEKIISGQWEITGGMWVEADTNLPNGESLVRQILLGKRFVRQEFGVEMRTLWLPDVFGYSWALPQIILKSGLKYFLTSKISWSQFNRFPHDTFLWRGIDGSEVLTHFITTPEENSHIYTYNGQLTPDQVQGMWVNYRQKELNDELLMLYGWGDGGGGPTQEMLESGINLKNLPGIPNVSLDRAETYLKRLEERLAGKDLPVWDGELYLEYHRGTYTSQAKSKRANRKAEVLYHNAEWLCTLAHVLGPLDEYPIDELRSGWERILLNQFHDILPGSSIRQVYEDSHEDYRQIETIGTTALDQAGNALRQSLHLHEQDILVLNSLSWDRPGLIEIPWLPSIAASGTLTVNGEEAHVQQVNSAEGTKALLEIPVAPSLGYQAYSITTKEPPAVVVTEKIASSAESILWQPGSKPSGASRPNGNGNGNGKHGKPTRLLPPPPQLPDQITPINDGYHEISVAPDSLENRFYRIELNDKGQITSIWDKENEREVLAEGKTGNVLQAFEDKPMNFDAWDVDIYYQEKMREVVDFVGAEVEEAGPLRGVLRLSWRFADSNITQRLTVYRSNRRIDFRTEVDWHERQVLLKVAFPVNIRATHATYDIQFGNIERPNHWNTSWDYARFESLGHKWADLSEGNFGVALLNDCKYGYDVKNNVIRLTLIKSAIHPDEQADQGEHIFTYSLLPHKGDWREGDVVAEAYDLNYPLIVVAGDKNGNADFGEGNLPQSQRFAEIDARNVILETVKQAEESEAVIVRFYEYMQYRKNRVRVRFGRPIIGAMACNLMEEDEEPAEFEGDLLSFPIDPYEIKTFKIWF